MKDYQLEVPRYSGIEGSQYLSFSNVGLGRFTEGLHGAMTE